MLNEYKQRHLVQGNIWKEYPSARFIEKFITCLEDPLLRKDPFLNAHINQVDGPDSLLERMRASLKKDPILHSSSKEEAELIQEAFELEKNTLIHLRETHKLACEIIHREIRLWLFDDAGQKLMSGFFDTLLIDERNPIGIVFKHHLNQISVPAQEDKELRCLALIASDTFKLKEIIVVSFQTYCGSYDLGAYDFEGLQAFKQDLQKLLKKPK
jgi:hypothetical protein